MSNYVVTSDSTCDLSPQQIADNNIVLKPITIILDGKEYHDGVDIDAKKILEFVDNGGDLPKTAAISIEEYTEFFSKLVADGKKVLHFNISSKASSCNSNAMVAAKNVGNVFVIDTLHLSTGQGLLVLKACDLLKSGLSVEEVYEKILTYIPKVQTSFVVDRLDFLHKGGRCSLIQLIGSKLLKLHPHIAMYDGQLKVKKKYTGSLKRSFEAYVTDLASEYTSYEKTRCFITNCMAEKEYVDAVYNKVVELFDFDEVIVTGTGSTVASHCGKNTIGVLFITE